MIGDGACGNASLPLSTEQGEAFLAVTEVINSNLGKVLTFSQNDYGWGD